MLHGACAPAAAPASRVTPGAPSLTLASYNINFGLAGDEETLEAIGRIGADVVFLQESTPAWERVIQGRWRSRYPRMEFRHSPGAGGLAVLSRFPVTSIRYLLPKGDWFPAWLVRVDSPLGPMRVLQVHLRPPISDGGSWVWGYLTTDQYRLDEMRHFAASLQGSIPTVILGDFNEKNSKAVAYVRQLGFTSALERFSPRAHTWRWQTSVMVLRHTLDHVFVSPELVAVKGRALDVGRSDHLPVVATVQLSTK
jgi:endonuclease/exonuclease/phosphatase family metal-dependent hydrolase